MQVTGVVQGKNEELSGHSQVRIQAKFPTGEEGKTIDGQVLLSSPGADVPNQFKTGQTLLITITDAPAAS